MFSIMPMVANQKIILNHYQTHTHTFRFQFNFPTQQLWDRQKTGSDQTDVPQQETMCAFPFFPSFLFGFILFVLPCESFRRIAYIPF
jgi:hypothetical protein